MRYSVPDWWSIETPDGWRVTEHLECTTFEPPTTESAVQVSAHRKDGDVTDDDLRDFAGNALLKPIALPHFTGFESASTEGRLFTRKLWLRAGALMILVTYISPLAARGREDSFVEEMLRSLSSAHATQEA